MLHAFLDQLEADDDRRARYLAAAENMAERVVFTGRLEHAELTDLLPACEALVVPSTFPEAFGMVAAEAAACGVMPISAHHSGLAEVSRALAQDAPDEAAVWLSFPLSELVVLELAERVAAWLSAPAELRERTREALVATARERWSWEGVARGVIDAAQGRLDALPRP
jgi:glycosyltransferase involved in cell wall biosynthesis